MNLDLKGAVVVVTGASSGIGRATALAFADRGAHLVLAARRAHALAEVARECDERGGTAIIVPTDTADEHSVQRVADRARERFGRIDVWVNDAAVSAFGRFDDTPPDVWRRVLEVNLFGYAYGARAVLPLFKAQGHGVLVNVSSVAADLPQPYTSAYGASKAAIASLTASLRQELLLDGLANVHVVGIFPPSVDTPLFQSAANFSGYAVQPIPPVYPAERVAAAIVSAAENPRREVYIGGAGKLGAIEAALVPGFAERSMAKTVDHDTAAERTRGNLYEPAAGTASTSTVAPDATSEPAEPQALMP